MRVAQYKTRKQAEEADKELAKKIQSEGRKENPKYVCSRWSDVTETEDGFEIVYHKTVDKLKVKCEIVETDDRDNKKLQKVVKR